VWLLQFHLIARTTRLVVTPRWKLEIIDSAVLWMLLLKRKGDQISLLMLIIFLCLQTHHRPARKREGWEHLTPFLIQSYGLEVTKKSEPEKPILCQIVREKRQSRTQCKKVSSWVLHRLQMFEVAMFLWWSRDSVGVASWQASQIKNLYFSGAFNLQIQFQASWFSLESGVPDWDRSQSYLLLAV
jgi:hypothetical protein